MGFYYGQPKPPDEDEPHGCMDVLLLTRAVFGVLLVPLGVLVGALVGVGAIVFLFSRSWILGIIALAVIAVGTYLYARWERRHFRSR